MAEVTEEQVAELERKARNCRDNAKAEMAVHDAFIAEYERGISGHPDACLETHKRTMELYDFTMGGRNRARNFERDAVIFETLAAHCRASVSHLRTEPASPPAQENDRG